VCHLHVILLILVFLITVVKDNRPVQKVYTYIFQCGQNKIFVTPKVDLITKILSC